MFSNLFQLVGNTVGGFFEYMNPTDPESSYRQGMEEVPAKVEEAMQEIGSSAAPSFVKEGLKFHLGLTMGATNLLPHHALGSASELGEFVGEKGSKSVGILWEEVARDFSENPSYMLGQMSAPSVLLKGRLGRVKGQHTASILEIQQGTPTRLDVTDVLQGVRWGPTTGAGPLGEKLADTFRGGSYTEMVTTETTTLYRVYGGKSDQLGSYWTRIAPGGPMQSQLDSGLLTEW